MPVDGQCLARLPSDREAARKIRCDHDRAARGGGEYPTQDGFGWTNGVTRKLMALYPADADVASVDQCPGPDGG